jgi:drug/metabolite transporter (DMT)-like permease
VDWRALGLGLAFVTMWSSAFASARIVVANAPPFLALSARFAISGLLALVIGWAMGQRIHLTRAQWGGVVIFGLCQNALYLGLNFEAMRTIEASVAVIIASMLPLFVAALGWVIFSERLTAPACAGMAAGFAGVLVIMTGRLDGGADAYGVALAVDRRSGTQRCDPGGALCVRRRQSLDGCRIANAGGRHCALSCGLGA